MSPLESKYQFAKELVLEAGAYIRRHLQDDVQVEEKTSPTDLVTTMDKAVQDFLVAAILKNYPSDSILAEENGLRSDYRTGNTWIIDPIDGTANFVAQKQDFAVMVAYFEEGVGRFGLIYDVVKKELYHGGGAFPSLLNDQPLPAFDDSKTLQHALIASNAGMYRHNYMGIADIVNHSLSLRVYGSAGISFSDILAGRLWAYFSTLYPWDYAAASILGESLGYTVLTMEGEKPDFCSRQQIMMVPKSRLAELQSYMKKDEQ